MLGSQQRHLDKYWIHLLYSMKPQIVQNPNYFHANAGEVQCASKISGALCTLQKIFKCADPFAIVSIHKCDVPTAK